MTQQIQQLINNLNLPQNNSLSEYLTPLFEELINSSLIQTDEDTLYFLFNVYENLGNRTNKDLVINEVTNFFNNNNNKNDNFYNTYYNNDILKKIFIFFNNNNNFGNSPNIYKTNNLNCIDLKIALTTKNFIQNSDKTVPTNCFCKRNIESMFKLFLKDLESNFKISRKTIY